MPVIQVAVGVVIDHHERVFISKRSENQHQGNKWEFPGGKVEKGETALEALTRELKEELDIHVQTAEFLMNITHTYPDSKTVSLDVFTVKQWQGTPKGNEGQPTLWVTKQALLKYDFPVANKAIIRYLETIA